MLRKHIQELSHAKQFQNQIHEEAGQQQKVLTHQHNQQG
jgi:hypothetical protein